MFGHEDKIKLFKKLVQNKNLGQAYLFFGDAEIGKFYFARHLAYYLEYGKFEILDEPLIDVGFFLPDEKGVVGIDTARAIKNFLSETPFRSPRRLAIINDAENLTSEAQSSLLKIVEEPPRSAMLIFIAHDPKVLFPPLLSRLAKIYFSRLTTGEIERILVETYKVPVVQARKIADVSFGRIGRALGLFQDSAKREIPGGLISEIEKEILALYQKDPIKNSGIISWLLERETALRRFNLNENLQAKVVQNKLHKP